MAGKIFISYRRDDTAADARGIRDGLARQFGAANVFMDVDNLLAGRRFDRELASALDRCMVLLAIIGPRWMEILSSRITCKEQDFVREEIAAALKRGIPVIPVRVGHEGRLLPLPPPNDLPDDLKELVLHQRHDMVHERFGRDIADLVAAIRSLQRDRENRWNARPILITVAFAILLACGLGAYTASCDAANWNIFTGAWHPTAPTADIANKPTAEPLAAAHKASVGQPEKPADQPPQPAEKSPVVSELEIDGLNLLQARAGSNVAGVVIADVVPNTDAAEKGLLAGDVILEVSGYPVSSPANVAARVLVAQQSQRSAVLLRLLSADQERFVAVKLKNSDVKRQRDGEVKAIPETGSVAADGHADKPIPQASEPRNIIVGEAANVRANSMWFQEPEKLSHWQELRRGGNATALKNYEQDVLGNREAWQFTNRLGVKVLSFNEDAGQVTVELTTPGRLHGTEWFVDHSVIIQ